MIPYNLLLMPDSSKYMITSGFATLNTDQCTLKETRIDIWQFSLAKVLHGASHIMNPAECAQAQRYHFQHHQRRYATARTSLRMILARYLNQAPESIDFSYNTYGKPSVIHYSKIQFNLSHSGDLALLAVGKNCSLGIDLESYSARPYTGIAKNLFSKQEFEEFIKTPQELKTAVFFHIWSQKEAFIKACGLGLSYPTQKFSVPTTIPTHQLVDDPIHNTTWKLQTFMPKVACSGALCYHPTIREIRYAAVCSQSLIDRLNFETW